MKDYDLLLKRMQSCIAIFTFLMVNLLSTPRISLAETENPSEHYLTPPSHDLSVLSIPGDLGTIQEVYQANSTFVILIQDAHAIPEAQRNIQKLIDYFQKHYEVNFIGLEGASSELDPQIFKSFPDKEILKKTFEEYMDKGEFTGGTASAIFNEVPAVYHGIEDWELYEEGITYYLKAMEKEGELTEKLHAERVRLQIEKEKTYSKALLEVDHALEAFRRNESDLITVLKHFHDKGIGSEVLPVPLSLQALLDEVAQEGEDSSAIEREVREIAEKIQQKVSDTVSDTIAFNQKYQAFQTANISAAEFGLWMKDFVEKKTGNHALLAPFSVKLLQQIQRHKRLRDLEGTQFFKEFEIYIQSVKESLFRNDTERGIDQKSRRLYLLEKLVKLELSREEWEEIREAPFVKREADFENHRAFYENAEDRDEVFFTNLKKLIERRGRAHPFVSLKSRVSDTVSDTAALLVAGGFHTEGLARQFKEKGISYVVIRPEIGQIPEKSFYRAHMQGDVSWKDYFRVEDGKVNLYDAFVRGTRDKLLGEALNVKREAQDDAGLMKYASQDTLHSSLLLKAWRDQIIRDLAQKEQLAKAHQYTQFLDEIANRGQSPFGAVPYLNAKNASLFTLRDSLARIDRFIQGIRYLERMEQLNKKSLFKLLNPSMIPPLTVSAAIDSTVRVDDTDLIRTLVRSETRHIKQEIISEGSEAGNLIDSFEKELPAALVSQHLTSIYSLNDQGSRLLDAHGKEIIYHFASARPGEKKVGAVSYIRIGNWMFFDHRLKPDLEILLQQKYRGLRPRIIYLHEMKSSLTDYKDAVAEWTGPMIAALDSIDLRGKTILDLGSGDGLLSLLAVKKGAAYAILVDYDPASYDLFTNHLAANEMNAGDFGFVGGDLRDKDRILKRIGTQPVNVIFGNIGEHPLIYPRGTHLDAISYLDQWPRVEYYLAGGYAPGQSLGNQDKYFKVALNTLKQRNFQEIAHYRQVYNFAQDKFGPKTALVMRRNIQRSEVRNDFENEQLVPIMMGVKGVVDEYFNRVKTLGHGKPIPPLWIVNLIEDLQNFRDHLNLYKTNHLYHLQNIENPVKRRFIELLERIEVTKTQRVYGLVAEAHLALTELLHLDLKSVLPQFAILQEIDYDSATDNMTIIFKGEKKKIKNLAELKPFLEKANIRLKSLGRDPKTGQTLTEFSHQLPYEITGRMAREYDRDLKKIALAVRYVLHHKPYSLPRSEVRNQQQTEKIPAREIESDRHSMMRGHLAGHVFEILSNHQSAGDVVLDTGRHSLIMQLEATKGKFREYALDDSFYQRLYPYFEKMGVREIRMSQEIISGWLTDSHPSKKDAIYELAAVLKASLTWKEGGLHRLKPLAGLPWGLAGYQHPSGKGIQIRVEKEEPVEDLDLRVSARGEMKKIVQLSQNNDIRIPIPDTATNYVFQIGLSQKRIQEAEVDEKDAVGRHAFIFQVPDNFVFYSAKEWNELVEKGFPEELVRQKRETLAKKKRGNIWLAKMPINGPPLVVYDAHSAGKDVLYIELIRIRDEENQLTLRISGPSKFIKGIEKVPAMLHHFDPRAEVRAGKPLTDVQMDDLYKALDEGVHYVMESFPGGIQSDEKTRRIVRISSDGSIWLLEINRADGVERLLEMADMGYAILKYLMKRPDINIRDIELEYDEISESMTYEKQAEEMRNLVIDFFRREAEGIKVHSALLSEENKYSLAEYNESTVRRRFVLKRSKTKINLSHVMDVQDALHFLRGHEASNLRGPLAANDWEANVLRKVNGYTRERDDPDAALIQLSVLLKSAQFSPFKHRDLVIRARGLLETPAYDRIEEYDLEKMERDVRDVLRFLREQLWIYPERELQSYNPQMVSALNGAVAHFHGREAEGSLSALAEKMRDRNLNKKDPNDKLLMEKTLYSMLGVDEAHFEIMFYQILSQLFRHYHFKLQMEGQSMAAFPHRLQLVMAGDGTLQLLRSPDQSVFLEMTKSDIEDLEQLIRFTRHPAVNIESLDIHFSGFLSMNDSMIKKISQKLAEYLLKWAGQDLESLDKIAGVQSSWRWMENPNRYSVPDLPLSHHALVIRRSEMRSQRWRGEIPEESLIADTVSKSHLEQFADAFTNLNLSEPEDIAILRSLHELIDQMPEEDMKTQDPFIGIALDFSGRIREIRRLKRDEDIFQALKKLAARRDQESGAMLMNPEIVRFFAESKDIFVLRSSRLEMHPALFKKISSNLNGVVELLSRGRMRSHNHKDKWTPLKWVTRIGYSSLLAERIQERRKEMIESGQLTPHRRFNMREALEIIEQIAREAGRPSRAEVRMKLRDIMESGYPAFTAKIKQATMEGVELFKVYKQKVIVEEAERKLELEKDPRKKEMLLRTIAKAQRAVHDVHHKTLPRVLEENRLAETPLAEALNDLKNAGFPSVADLLVKIYPMVLPEIISGEEISPVHHVAYVTHFVTQIALGELGKEHTGGSLTREAFEKELKRGVFAALFHDAGLGAAGGEGKLRKDDIKKAIQEAKERGGTPQEVKSEIDRVVIDGILSRWKHMVKGSQIASAILMQFPEDFTPEDIQAIQRLVGIHDNNSVQEYDRMLSEAYQNEGFSSELYRGYRQKLSDATGGVYAVDEKSFLLPAENPLMKFLREADRLWMITEDGIDVDLERDLKKMRDDAQKKGEDPQKVAINPLDRVKGNIKRHYEEPGLYRSVLGSEGEKKYGFINGTLYRTGQGYEIFERLVKTLEKKYSTQFLPLKQGDGSLGNIANPRSELRNDLELTVESLAKVITKSTESSFTVRDVIRAVTVLQTHGIKELRSELRKAVKEYFKSGLKYDQVIPKRILDKVWQEESQSLLRTLPVDSMLKASESGGTVAVVLPGRVSDSFAGHLVKTALRANLDTVALVGKGHAAAEITGRLKSSQINAWPVSNLNRPMTVIGQPAVPTGVFGDDFESSMNEVFLPFWINMGYVNDPLVRDYVEEIQSVALAHTAQILQAKPELLSSRSELRAELLKRLALFEGFDSVVTTGERWGQSGFAISATVAQAYLEHRSELRLRQSA